MPLSPIVLFVYNRLDYTRQTLQALLKDPLAKESELFIYSDAPKNQDSQKSVQEVRNYIHSITGFANITIIERDQNFGLANSIIDGVTTTIKQYKKAIILEDDLVVSPNFLSYINQALDLYENEKNVACITAFNFPLEFKPPLKDETFFLKGADCWAWATWERAWNLFEKDGKKLLKTIKDHQLQKEFDFDHSYPYTKMLQNQIEGKNDSWAIRWYASAFLQNMLCLYPKHSLVENIGVDGTHFKNAKKDQWFGIASNEAIQIQKIPTIPNPQAREAFILFFKSRKFFYRILKSLFFWKKS